MISFVGTEYLQTRRRVFELLRDYSHCLHPNEQRSLRRLLSRMNSHARWMFGAAPLEPSRCSR